MLGDDVIMIVTAPKVMCTGRPEPKAWEFNGRSGMSYKVQISDGQSNLELPCATPEVYNLFSPFKTFQVNIEVSQVANDNRLATRCRVVGAQAVS